MTLSQQTLQKYKEQFPLLEQIIDLKSVTWLNEDKPPFNELKTLPLGMEDIEEAEALWHRFQPFFVKAFPETENDQGIIESPLIRLEHLQEHFDNTDQQLTGTLYLKCDHALSIAGSIKARGGFYEVLHYAEKLALSAGKIKQTDNYEEFLTEDMHVFFSQYTIGVGSTGNLGLSIGIMSAKLGFNVNVYMSRDAKQWKKDLLREKGATVYEFEGDFGEAIKAGRQQTIDDPNGYFVDDEDSKELYLGYSTAALRLQKQLIEQGITVDSEHPLFVYLPCGVGGAPGGVTFGLKQLFGDNVHCFFVEPVESPSVLIGLLTGEMDKVSVQDFGISNRTEADGLAVGTPSTFATPISDKLISGDYTVEDDALFKMLATLAECEKIFVEPSATAGLFGPHLIMESSYMKKIKAAPQDVTHIAWSTGGYLVPEQEMKRFYEKGKTLIQKDL